MLTSDLAEFSMNTNSGTTIHRLMMILMILLYTSILNIQVKGKEIGVVYGAKKLIVMSDVTRVLYT